MPFKVKAKDGTLRYGGQWMIKFKGSDFAEHKIVAGHDYDAARELEATIKQIPIDLVNENIFRKQTEINEKAKILKTLRKAVKLTEHMHAIRYAAWVAVNVAIKTGKIKKPKHCECCFNEDKKTIVKARNKNGTAERSDIAAHHYDYNKPLDVVWLCNACHNVAHRVSEARYKIMELNI